MPNSTAIRRQFTRLRPVLSIDVVRSNTRRAALLALLVVSAAGCDSKSIPPTMPGPRGCPRSPPRRFTTVRLEGRIVDEHTDQGWKARGSRSPGLTLVHPSTHPV